MRRGLVIFLVIAAGTAALTAPAGFTVQDLVAMDRLSELASSSAHSRLAFTVSCFLELMRTWIVARPRRLLLSGFPRAPVSRPPLTRMRVLAFR